MDGCDNEAELRRTFRDLARVHRWLRGRADICRALSRLLPRAAAAKVLDVGCGDGDAGRAILRWAERSGRHIDFTGVDRNQRTIALAHTRSAGATNDPRHSVERLAGTLRFAAADALLLPFADRSFDIVLISLTLHHFDGGARRAVVRELARVASRAVIVNDLHRNWLNYAGAKILAATLWRRSRLTRHDGPVSVLRAFTPDELASTLAVPMLRPARVRRRFFHRLLAVAERADSTRGGTHEV